MAPADDRGQNEPGGSEDRVAKPLGPGRTSSPLDPNLAARYIEWLTGSVDAAVTFQTFDDGLDKRPELAGWHHGTLAQHWERLVSVSALGGGVFVMVNEGDGRGRSTANVRALRALFVDADEAPLPELRVPASFWVVSRRGEHAYWLLEPGEPLEAFGPAQKALISHLRTDPKVHDLPRVMRLPGFPHQKAEPYPVGLVEGTLRRHTIAELLESYPPARPPVARPAMTWDARSGAARPHAVRLLERAAAVAAADGRNNGGLWLACQLRDNGYDKGEAGSVMLEYARLVAGAGEHPYRETEALASLNQAYARQPREAWAGSSPGRPTRSDLRSRVARRFRRLP